MQLKCMLAAAVMLLAVLPASAFLVPGPASDDVWDISQGGFVTESTSILSGSSAWNMIGDQQGTVEFGSGSCLFADGHSSGYEHWMRWETPADVRIGRFDLYAEHDGNTGRSFDYFTLLAVPVGGTEYVTIYESAIGVPYVLDDFTKLLISYDFANPTTAHKFEARYRQHTDIEYAEGPRILELDGFVAIPEPCSIGALCFAVVGFIGFVRRRA